MRYSVRAPSCLLFSCLSLLFLSILLLGVLSYAHGGENKQVNLEVSCSHIDFGILEEGPAVVKEVLLKNSSDTEIIIKNVKASWACTNIALGKRTLHPEEQTVLTITYNTFKFPGEFKKYVIVTTAKPEEQDFVITLRGFVKEAPMGKIHIEPREIDLGPLGLETSQKQSYKISNVGTAPLTINKIYSIKSKTIYYDENKEGAIIIQPQETKVIELEIKPYKEGRFIEVIIFNSDARNSDENGYKIVVMGKGEGNI